MTTQTRLPTHRKPTRTLTAAPRDLPAECPAEQRLAMLLSTGGVHFPPLGGTAVRLHRMAVDPRTSLEAVVRLIEHEPGLALRVMRLANSAAMAAAHPVKDLRGAVLRIGIQGVRDMAFALGLGTVVHAAPFRDELTRAYRHCFMVASGSHWACRAVGLDGALGFLCGLMQDVGVLGILVTLAPHVLKDPTLADGAALEALVEREHAQVGEELLTHWRLPSMVVTVARWHHCPERAGAAEPMVRLCAAVGRAAEVLSKIAMSSNLPLRPHSCWWYWRARLVVHLRGGQ